MKSLFNCLYYLENSEISIFEIKRLDLPEGSPVAEVYQWFLFNRSSGQLKPLKFQSMDSGVGIEERFFIEGYLKFGAEQGAFIEKYNAAQYQLKNNLSRPISQKLAWAIQSFYEQVVG